MALLTTKQMQERLSQVVYKDWKISIYDGAFEGLKLEIDAVVEDSTNPGNQTRLHIISPFIPCFTVEQFDYTIAKRLIIAETHEVLEMFKDKKTGKPIFDPHRENANRDML